MTSRKYAAKDPFRGAVHRELPEIRLLSDNLLFVYLSIKITECSMNQPEG